MPLRTGDKLPALFRSFALERGALDKEARTITGTFSTEEAEVQRWFGREILDHSPGSVDMSRMQDGAAFLMDHDTRDQRGVVEDAKITKGVQRGTIRFSKSKRGEELMNEIDDGIRKFLSIGYLVNRIKLEEEGEEGDTYRVTEWEPFEVSSVAVPADTGAQLDREAYKKYTADLFGKRANEFETRVTVETPKTKPTQMTKKEKDRQAAIRDIAEQLGVAEDALNRALEDAEVTPESFRAENTKAPAPEPAPADPPQKRTPEPAPKIDEAELARKADEILDKREENREEIPALADSFPDAVRHMTENPPEGAKIADPVKRAFKEKTTVADFQSAILDAQRAMNPSVRTPREVDKPESGTREAMEDSFREQARTIAERLGHKLPEFTGRVFPAKKRGEGVVIIGDRAIEQVRTLTGAINLADVVVLDAGIGSPIIEEALVEAPELSAFPIEVIGGGEVKLSVRTGLPTVAFRNANEGRDYKRGTFESKMWETMIIEEPIGVDIQGVLNASKDPARVMSAEALAVSAAVLEHVAEQSWYGATAQAEADAKAAPGIYAQYSTANEVDVGDTTALSSVWMLKLGDNFCDHVYGNDTTLNIGPFTEATLTDSNNKKLRGMEAFLSGRFAPRLANKHAAVRLKNCGSDTPALTDAMLFSAYKLFRTNKIGQPNVIFMTPREQETLRLSRTATHPEGAPVPIPEQWNGIPIVTTNNLSLAETI